MFTWQRHSKTAQIGVIDLEGLARYAEPGDLEALGDLQRQVQEHPRHLAEEQDNIYKLINLNFYYNDVNSQPKDANGKLGAQNVIKTYLCPAKACPTSSRGWSRPARVASR